MGTPGRSNRIYQRSGTKTNPVGISETECAWAAGLIDGEGSFVYGKARNSFRFAVYNSEMELLERCQRVIGGRIYEVKRREKRPHWKRAYVLEVYGWYAQRYALDLIVHYLTQPKINQINRALIAIDDFRSESNHRSNPRWHKPKVGI